MCLLSTFDLFSQTPSHIFEDLYCQQSTASSADLHMMWPNFLSVSKVPAGMRTPSWRTMRGWSTRRLRHRLRWLRVFLISAPWRQGHRAVVTRSVGRPRGENWTHTFSWSIRRPLSWWRITVRHPKWRLEELIRQHLMNKGKNKKVNKHRETLTNFSRIVDNILIDIFNII